MIDFIKSFFTSKPVTYVVTDCPKMPSAIGMEMTGKPTITSLIVKKGDEFRTIVPQSVKAIEKGFIVETKYLTVTFHEKL